MPVIDYSRPPGFEFEIDKFIVTVRDGTRLETEVFRPVKDSMKLRMPTIFELTPYDFKNFRPQAKFFAKRGYNHVLTHTRGRYGSEGVHYHLSESDAQDGYDLVEWIAKQSWSDGRVGTTGCSYGAVTQSALASLNPPHLKAMFVAEGPSNCWKQSVRNHGAVELRIFMWGFFLGAGSGRRGYRLETLPDPIAALALGKELEIAREWLTSYAPLRKGETPIRYVPEEEARIYDFITKSDYDEFWMKLPLNIEAYYGNHADAPICFFTGWYDSFTQSAIDNYVGLKKIKKGPITLVVGPWTHGWDTTVEENPKVPRYAGEVDFGEDGDLDIWNLQLRWFDQYLNGIDNGVAQEPPVRVFVMGGGDGKKNAEGRLNHGGKWRFEKDWPIPGTKFVSYFLHGDGSLSTNPPEEDEPSKTTYQFDPRNPVPTIGGNVSGDHGLIGRGAFDQRCRDDFFACRGNHLPLSARRDVLVFSTPALREDIEITGPIVVKLWGSSSAVDTDFTAKLLDVYPLSIDYPLGFAMNLCDGIIRARYRNSWKKPEFMKPGEVYEFKVEPYSTSNLFKKGHRIRLDISSSNFPRFDINPNTGEPIGLNRRAVVAENTVYHRPKHPSHVVLPTVPSI